MSIEKYLSTLTLDQLNYCKQKASELIDKAAQQEKKYVWLISELIPDGMCNIAWFKEEDYEKACNRFLEVFKERFPVKARCLSSSRFAPSYCDIPVLRVERVTQMEYDEYFPEED